MMTGLEWPSFPTSLLEAPAEKWGRCGNNIVTVGSLLTTTVLINNTDVVQSSTTLRTTDPGLVNSQRLTLPVRNRVT